MQYLYFYKIVVILILTIFSVKHTNAAVLEKYLQQLKDPTAVTRAYAAYKLGEMGQRASSAIPDLVILLNDHHQLEWRKVSDFPGQGKTTYPSKEAAMALSKMGSKGVSALKAAFYTASKGNYGTKEERAIGSIVQGLSRIRDGRAVDVMVMVLFIKTSDDSKTFAGDYLARIKDPSTFEPLIQVVMDTKKVPYARYAAALALGELKDPRAIDPLIETMCKEDPSSFVVYDPRGNRKQVTHKDLPIVQKIAAALTKITQVNLGPNPERWREWRRSIRAAS